ncbi:MAG: hypothetical protein KatS3mg011_2294 [Acidimicrobiia bacterium]|nr:MAG: hypothetical protein KatS3mg011_2294 [Acidimicrobiia bacterium]
MVAVLGSGVAGLLTQLAAWHLGAAAVTATWRYPHQAEAASSLGPTQLVEVGDWESIKRLEPDLVIEAVGGEAPTFEQALKLCDGEERSWFWDSSTRPG